HLPPSQPLPSEGLRERPLTFVRPLAPLAASSARGLAAVFWAQRRVLVLDLEEEEEEEEDEEEGEENEEDGGEDNEEGEEGKWAEEGG
ncbi:unnamed protein product, partial [Closterium sp. NIES-53]